MSKEEEKTQNVDKVGSSDAVTVSGTFLLVGQKVDSLAHHGDKLGQLHQSQRRLPPDRKRLSSLRILGMHADKVVSVHDGMNESIQYNGQENISIILSLGIEPVEEEDGEMMVDVEERKLSPLLSQDNENGVPEIPNLRNVKQPEKVGNRWVDLIVIIAAY